MAFTRTNGTEQPALQVGRADDSLIWVNSGGDDFRCSVLRLAESGLMGDPLVHFHAEGERTVGNELPERGQSRAQTFPLRTNAPLPRLSLLTLFADMTLAYAYAPFACVDRRALLLLFALSALEKKALETTQKANARIIPPQPGAREHLPHTDSRQPACAVCLSRSLLLRPYPPGAFCSIAACRKGESGVSTPRMKLCNDPVLSHRR